MKYKYKKTPQRHIEVINLEKVTGGMGFRYDKPKNVKTRSTESLDR